MATRVFSALGLLLLAVLLWRSAFVVDEGEVALITRFGQILPGDYGPGAHLKSAAEREQTSGSSAVRDFVLPVSMDLRSPSIEPAIDSPVSR